MNIEMEWQEDTQDIGDAKKISNGQKTGEMQIDEGGGGGNTDHDLAAEKKEEESRNRDPLKYCVLIAENPKKAFG